MYTLSELLTPQEVDAFIDQDVCRNMPTGFRLEWEAKWPDQITAADRTNMKVDALCHALARRDELRARVTAPMQPAGEVMHVRV